MHSFTVFFKAAQLYHSSTFLYRGPQGHTPGSVIHEEDWQNSAHSCTHSYDLLQWKDTKQSQQTKKAYGGKPRENQAQASKSPLPVESHRTA